MLPFFDFHYGFSSFGSTAVLLTDVFDRIAWNFNRSGTTRVVTFHVFKAFARIWQNFGIVSYRRLQVVFDRNSLQVAGLSF